MSTIDLPLNPTQQFPEWGQIYDGSVDHVRGWWVLARYPCMCPECEAQLDEPVRVLPRGMVRPEGRFEGRFEVTVTDGRNLARLEHAHGSSLRPATETERAAAR